jgi:hypothetical protein
MITTYELIYIRFLTIRIQPYELVHHLTVQIHRQNYTNLSFHFIVQICYNNLIVQINSLHVIVRIGRNDYV